MSKLRRPTGTVASVLVHAAVLAAILYRAPVHIAPMRLPGTTHGSHIELAYLPSTAPQPAPRLRSVTERRAGRMPGRITVW